MTVHQTREKNMRKQMTRISQQKCRGILEFRKKIHYG
ncbi:hypothetical protein CK3_27070 [butyrate-producing bacterium SS3/4]|nr:hypothetical protein CK3_27070 [butyrate-producing bacterium SS3/4]